MKKHFVYMTLTFGLLLTNCKDESKEKATETAQQTEIAIENGGKFNENDLLGTWIDQTPEAIKYNQGFTLSDGGVAKEVGSNTLFYTSWKYDNTTGDLFLSGTSEGNSGAKEPFTDSLIVVSLSKDSLVVKPIDAEDDIVIKYLKK